MSWCSILELKILSQNWLAYWRCGNICLNFCLWSGTFASFYFVVRIWGQNWGLGMGGFGFATKHLQFWVIKLKLMLFHLSCYSKTGHCLNIWLQFTHSHKTMCLFLLRDTLRVDLVPIVWHTAPPKVRRPRNRVLKKRLFLGVFLEKKVFLAKRSTFTYSMSYRFWKLLVQRLI